MTTAITPTAPAMLREPRIGARWVGIACGLPVVIASVAGGVLAHGPGGRSLVGMMHDNVLNNVVNGLVFGVVATLLMWLRPANRVGWLLMYVGAVNAVAILGEGWVLASYNVSLPGRTPMAWLGSWIWAPALFLGATVLPAIYPTGRATTRMSRWIVRVGWTASVLFGLALSGLDDAYDGVGPGHQLGPNPLTHGHFQPVFLGAAVLAVVTAVALSAVTIGWTIRRLARASSPEREQLAWLVVSVLPVIVAVIVGPPVVLFVVTLLTTVTLLVGVVRHQLFDVKLILRSGLLYGALIGLAAGAYFAAVAAAGVVSRSTAVPTFFAAAVVALLARPAYLGLSRWIGRFVYGDRADPARALGRLGPGLEGALGPDLDAVVAAVAESLRSPYVEVLGDDGRVLASAGRPQGHAAQEVALSRDAGRVGTLRVCWRTPSDPPSGADRALIEVLAVPVAVAVHATRLARDVEESRARVIDVRAAERSRLRADLHDGVGPSLSGAALGIEAALRSDRPEHTREILGVVHGEIKQLVREIRCLIDDLGPAGLEHGHLPDALAAHVEAVNALGAVRVAVAIDPLPQVDLPIEVAVHRIATEAITNVVRHASATSATLALRCDGSTLVLEICDDGVGMGCSTPGVGRVSMHERAESVGGVLTTTDERPHGTRVRAAIPVQTGSMPKVRYSARSAYSQPPEPG
ncbi:sensor histidine kinase [Flexivirga alba]|uniref:histidine kinase n=1 Tax=Flexivirga alba TaxID=702742 RepID=A0ABW2AFB8_9MICO